MVYSCAFAFMFVFFFKQKTAYEMRISDWSSDVCSSDLVAMGLATRVCADPRAEALALAREIASKNPDAIRGGKRLLNLAAEADQHAILLAESKEQGALSGPPTPVEAVTAKLQKRKPKFAA